MAVIFFLFFLFFPFTSYAQPALPFQEVQIDPPFHQVLIQHPEFMKQGGAKLFVLDSPKKILIGIAKVFPEDTDPEAMCRERIKGALLARAAILSLGGEVAITTSRGLNDTSTTANKGKDRVSLSSFFQVTASRVEGEIKRLPVVGTWWSKDYGTFYVAVGTEEATHLKAQSLDAGTEICPEISGLEPFVSILRASPVLRENGGVRGFVLKDGRKVIIAVSSAPIKGSWTKARRIAQLRAVRDLLGAKKGIRISQVEYLSDQEHLKIAQEGETRVMLSEFLSVVEEKVSGMIKPLPVVATWEEPKGKMLYVGIGGIIQIVDKSK